MKAPIPDDWDEQADGYCMLFACIPNSPLWRATYRGLFYGLTWWYVWDKRTGSINGAKAVANDALESLCMATCQDIVTALNNIAVKIEAISTATDLTEQNELLALQVEATKSITSAINRLDLATNITVNEAGCNDPACGCQQEPVDLENLICQATGETGNADPDATGPY